MKSEFDHAAAATQITSFALRAKKQHVTSEMRQSYCKIVLELPAKVHESLFEMVLTFGIKMNSPEDDQFWFAIMNAVDYGSIKDLQIVEIVTELALELEIDTWKVN